MEDVKGVVFDMDGVLLDTEAVYDICWQMEADRLHLENMPAVHRKCLGMDKADSIRVLKAHYGNDFDGDAFWNATDSLCKEVEENSGVPLKPFAKDTLGYLKEKNILIALASSTYRDTVTRQLDRANLISFFDAIVCGDEVRSAKPEPDVYAEACKRLNLIPKVCAAVEDSPRGLLSAYRAGLRCILIPDRVPADSETKKMAWKVFETLQELRTCL